MLCCYTFFLKLLHCYYECCYINVAVNIVKNVATNFARNVATANAMDDVISNFCSNFSTKNVCSNFFKNVATIFCADIKILNAEQYRHAGRFKNPCFRQSLVVVKTIRICISSSGLIGMSFTLAVVSHFFAYNKKSKTKVVSHNSNGNNLYLYSQCPRYCNIIA